MFDALTALQPDIDTVDKLTLNPEGTDTLTVIFNPTCQPCMQKIPQLFQLYRTKQNTRIELIFFLNAQAPPTDDPYTLAKAMIREYETDPDRFPEMLSQYASHYPNRVKPLLTKYKHAGRENQRLQQSLANQTAWCLKNNIFATPQLLFNHKKVPDLYTLSDIDYRCD